MVPVTAQAPKGTNPQLSHKTHPPSGGWVFLFGRESGAKKGVVYQGSWYRVLLMKKNAVSFGRRGGRASSPAKALAARQNILIRWHGRERDGVIPEPALIDGAWYQGRGRSAPLALWDAAQGVFRTISWSSMPDPALFPEGGRRVFRLKQERHSLREGGTFSPMKLIPIQHEAERGD